MAYSGTQSVAADSLALCGEGSMEGPPELMAPLHGGMAGTLLSLYALDATTDARAHSPRDGNSAEPSVVLYIALRTNLLPKNGKEAK